MTDTARNRQPSGHSSGGQFAPKDAAHPDPSIDLDEESMAPPESPDDMEIMVFEVPDGRQLEVDHRGDGHFAVYSDGQLLAEFTSLADPGDDLAVEEAVRYELELEDA